MEIKIAVAYHKPSLLLTSPIYIPIQVGSAIHPDVNLNIQKDNDKDNISDENGYLCELTALYWIWKNVKSDAKGLFHYRRIFSPNRPPLKLKIREVCHRLMRRCFIPNLSSNEKSFISVSEEFANKAKGYFTEYDILVTRPCLCYPNVYAFFSIIDQEYLNILKRAVKSVSPELFDSLIYAYEAHELYYGNMSVMKSDIFDNYCQFMFGTLNEVKRILLSENYLTNLYEEKIFSRKLGYLAEILTSTYVHYLKSSKNLRIKEFYVSVLA